MIRKVFVVITLISSLYGFDFSDVSKAVDLKMVKESINKDEAKKAIKKGKNITLDDIAKSIDIDKAKKSINKDEMKKLFKF
jgi:hypothetical protein